MTKQELIEQRTEQLVSIMGWQREHAVVEAERVYANYEAPAAEEVKPRKKKAAE